MIFLGFDCKIYAYDHTIKDVPPRRGQQIHYFKTGIGFGANLKPLSKLIKDNKHTNSTIEYLKAISLLLLKNVETFFSRLM